MSDVYNKVVTGWWSELFPRDDTIDADGPSQRRKNSGDKRDDSTSHKDMAYTWSRNLVPKDNVATWPRAIRAHVVKAICVTP